MKIGFYPGCSMKGGAREYQESVVALAKVFDIELVEIPDWNCCGATAAHNLNKELSLSLPARIMALAEKEGITDIVVPCAACYNRLSVTKHELAEDASLCSKVTGIIDLKYSGKTNILNIIQFIDKYITDKLEEKVVKPFNYNTACYYGCLLVRPHAILNFDRVEDPQSMDVLVKKSGGNAIDWAFKTECCGAGMSVSRTDTVARLSGDILKDASDRKAEVMVVACPMCHSNLDMRRPEINKYLDEKISMPVLYISQVLGLAVGLDAKTLGLNRHMTEVILPDKPVKNAEPAEVSKKVANPEKMEA
ncbi:MAG: CoB--CoM heterodisulfide reductase iron-sulfur subunit B family protein [Bacteroidetes bacterium]|nr:CoB--CoM heterodisulfide reductase iron-sulfur subunit B family protein [Bacteroidota bacterium]